MGTIKVVLPDELEKKLRSRIAQTKGLHKGVLSETVTEAIEQWLHNPQSKIDVDQLREEYPGKYLGIVNGEVEFVRDSIDELFSDITNYPDKVYIVHPKSPQRKVRLGWRSSVRK